MPADWMQSLTSCLQRHPWRRQILLLVIASTVAIVRTQAWQSTPVQAQRAEERSLNDRSEPTATSTDAPLDASSPTVNLGQQCQSLPFPLSVQTVTQVILQLVEWVEQPQSSMEPLITMAAPQWIAQLNPSPWPEIHDQARLAKVPVIMYHDIVAEKDVFFDVTPEEFEAHLQLIRNHGLTPVSMDQLVNHLRTGLPLPEKPILLTFDDGYLGHHDYVWPLLQDYGYPGLFSIYTYKVGRDHGRPGLDWEQLAQMAADPLVTIAAHSITHPADLRDLSIEDARQEIAGSKQELEERLGIPIDYFTYPEGNYDGQVAELVSEAGFSAALTMSNTEDLVAGESDNLLAIARLGQSQLEDVLDQAWGGVPLGFFEGMADFTAPIIKQQHTVDDIPLTLITGGKPITVHADSRYQVQDIIANTDIVAAVDGGFFSLEYLDSNQMIGPVYSQNTQQFIPGDRNDIYRLINRPLVMMNATGVQFIPFNPDVHNSLEGLQTEMPDITDAFIAAAWLVRDGQPQPAETFAGLFDFDAKRHRAFWGINQAGQPVIGVSHNFVDSVHLGEILANLGLYNAVMLDSGASTSLSYEGASLVGYEPRPVPHIVGLMPPISTDPCATSLHGMPASAQH